MFKIPGNLPSSTDNVEVFADFVEWQCYKNSQISLLSVLRPIMKVNDEIVISGIEDESDELVAKSDGILAEIERRGIACGGKYPFDISDHGYTLTVKTDNEINYWTYLYLLLCTRLNMLQSKVQAGIDGTLLFEKLSAPIAKNYFGEPSKSFVFGTAVAGSFPAKINDLCAKIGEGYSYLNRSAIGPNANDDKLDIVVYKNFPDEQWSKLIGFGQCKTGTSWDDASTIELQPSDFCKKWLRDFPIVTPIKMFFCSQYFPLDSWDKVINAGLVIDRFRIMAHLTNDLEQELSLEIKTWSETALAAFN